jgi:Tfp pilus assembly protein PilN
MTEIDFIPQWYQAGRNRRLWYQRQVFIICLAGFAVVLWCMAAGRGLSQAQAQLSAANTAFESGIGKIQQREQLSNQYSQLQQQAKILELVVARTSYTAILAELSCCIGPQIVIKKLDIYPEPVAVNPQKADGKVKKMRLTAGTDNTEAQRTATQTCIVLNGYAADARQVAELISSLEQSDYFVSAVPAYSKNAAVNERSVTEFEIRCIVADYELLNQ